MKNNKGGGGVQVLNKINKKWAKRVGQVGWELYIQNMERKVLRTFESSRSSRLWTQETKKGGGGGGLQHTTNEKQKSTHLEL